MDTSTLPSASDPEARDRLVDSLRDIVSDAEALLKSAQRLSEPLAAGHARFESRLNQVLEELAALQESAAHEMRHAARVADHAVHTHPYATAGLAAGVGVLVGLLISRR